MSIFMRNPERDILHTGSSWFYPVNVMEYMDEQMSIVDDMERRMMLNQPLENWQMKRLNDEIQIGCPLQQDFGPKDIKVSYDEKNHLMCVEAAKTMSKDSDTSHEAYQSQFKQSMTLPDDVDPNQIKANLSNNKHLLTIKAPLKDLTHENQDDNENDNVNIPVSSSSKGEIGTDEMKD